MDRRRLFLGVGATGRISQPGLREGMCRIPEEPRESGAVGGILDTSEYEETYR